MADTKNPLALRKPASGKNDQGKVELLTDNGSEYIKQDYVDLNDIDPYNSAELRHSMNVFNDTELINGLFNQRYRYGVLNPYQNITTAREVLFFTKPDLNIIYTADANMDQFQDISGLGLGGGFNYLNKTLYNYPFFTELIKRFPLVINCLQSSLNSNGNPFNHLLGNMVQSNLDVPATTADMIETPSNVYGVSYKYRGSSEAGDDNHTFSLEFKDTKYLPVYHFFKAYDLYEILKHHGAIRPRSSYTMNKVLHDQYSIYKFILDEDMETIIYYAKYYGVKSLNLPRDVFNTTTFDNGISYSIDFDAAFVEDMDPRILVDFNTVGYKYWSTRSQDIPVFNLKTGKVDMRSAQAAIVAREISGQNGYTVLGTDISRNGQSSEPNLLHSVPGSTTGGVFKLKWRGDQKV